MLYQFIWHIYMGFELLCAVYGVNNRRVYARHWMSFARPLLPIAHTYLLLILPVAGVLGGVAADMCMVYYFYQHYEILTAMNHDAQIRFLTRPQI
jgi:hypothetical protein